MFKREPRINPRRKYLEPPKKPRVVVKKVKSSVIDPKVNRYIKNQISGMENKNAAIQAGYPLSVAKKAAERIETLEVKKRMLDILDAIGLTDESLALDLKEGLREANKLQGTGDNFVEIPDYGVRHKYLETALKLKGELQGEKREKENIQILIVDYESDKNKSTT
jgi:hypothetical protein